jgi:phosphatidylglycerol:prolipoprotein diacylglycerol transferase
MYPEPLSFIGIHFVRSYGVMLALAFLLSILWARKRAIKAGVSPDHVVDLSFVVLLSSIVGSRFFYVIYHLDEYSDNLLAIINPFQGGSIGISGLSMMGGVVLALISAALFFKIKKINPWPVCDAMMPMFALGLGIARVGCFLNGCCYGLPALDHFGLIFPPDSAAGYHFPDTPLIPTQIYSSLAGISILAIVLLSEKFKKFDGHSFWLTAGLYGIWRFIIDFFRYYEDSMVTGLIGTQAFSRNQILSLLLTLVAAFAFIRLYLKWKKGSAVNAEPGG